MLKRTRKAITLILAFTMLVSVFSSLSIVGGAASATDDKTDYPMFYTEAGSVAIEVEKIIIDNQNVTTESAKDASARKSAKFLLTDVNQPAPDTTGQAGFKVTFDQDGKYAIWIRYAGPSADSIWFDYGSIQEKAATKGYVQIGFERTESLSDFKWRKITVAGKKAGETSTIRMIAREDPFVVDKIVITKVMGYTPEGTGALPDPSTVGKVVKLPEDRYAIPTVTPPPEHPRVFFRASDIPQIKKNMEHPEMATLVAAFNELKAKEYTGELANKDPNYDAMGLQYIAAKALDYALYGNEENGKKAISAIKTYAESLNIESLGDNCRHEGHVIRTMGQVYDWCYPLLTAEDKEKMMYLAQGISSQMEVGFPPDVQEITSGHGAEMQLYGDWFTMAIACYDEYPDAYNMIGGKIFSPSSVDLRNWWYQSGTHSQGTAYGIDIRHKSELYAHLLVKKMCGAELFNEEDLVSVVYDWIYRRRPDGMLMIDGEDNYPNQTKKGTYMRYMRGVMFLSSVISGDPIIKKEFLLEDGFEPTYAVNYVPPIEMLVLNNPNIDTDVSIGQLPLTTYHASPVGEMIARTGWDMGTKSDDVVATMTITEYNGMNHTHYDCGHFMIYYKGPLANDSGWYEKHSSTQNQNYMSQSVAHNTLVIETEANKWGNQNQGLERGDFDKGTGSNHYTLDATWEAYQANQENHWADVIGHEFGPDVQYPEYSYLAGDIANAYTSKFDNGVEEVLRHMIFLPTGDVKNPAAFIVFDKITTKEGGKKKAFLLHSEEEPEVNGKVTTIKRTEGDYNGKLVNQTLLPKEAKIEKIGGAEFDANGKVVAGTDKRFWNKNQNWPLMQDLGLATGNADAKRTVDPNNSLEAGWGRVEIMPKSTGKTDYMLNVMYVGDADDKSAVKNATLIETQNFAGAKIFDRVVMFNKNKARTKDTVTFTVPGGEQALKINVAGLEAGTWSISAGEEEIPNQIASQDGGIIYFTAPAGNVTLTYVSDNADKKFTDSGAPELEGVSLYYNDNFVYSDVPPTIINGRTLIPMRAILEAMNADVKWDEKTATAVANDGYTEIKITENQTTAYVDGEPVELDVPAMIIDGRFVIPVRFVAESFEARVTWDEFAKMVRIKSSKGQKSLGVKNVIGISDAKMSGFEGTPGRDIPASYDGDYDTYWGVSSADNFDAWGIYDLGRVKKLDKVYFSFMQGEKRKYKFDIDVSDDGINFTSVIKGGETSGTYPVGNLEGFDLGGASGRYVRYRGHGNSVNMWNSLVEIVFSEKK
ncbi:MAG: hypothetical protein E7410_05835 [Ruminococcaceae bacterium]|nr:hypothetical protein [Oscillospiraceae bacterium]